MNLAVLLGLASAGCYGTADFMSHFAGRRSGVLRTMLYGQLLAAIVLTALVLTIGARPVATPRLWAVLIASDLGILLATSCLYRALAIGNLAVVPPVVACYGAVAVVLSILSGERVTGAVVGGLLLAVGGGALASVPARGAAPAEIATSSGAPLAAAAALLYGVGFWIQGRVAVPVFGSLIPMWSYYLMGVVVLLTVGVVSRRSIAPPGMAEAPAVFSTALLGLGGYATLAMGQATGHVAIVTALSSVASAVTVLLARSVLKQLVSIHGWVGLGLVVAGLIVVDLAA